MAEKKSGQGVSRKDFLKGAGTGVAAAAVLGGATGFLTACNSDKEEIYSEIHADYVVFKDNAAYQSVNGHTGKVDFSGVDLKIVLQDTIESLSEGFIWAKNIPMPADMTYKDYVTIISTYKGQLQFYGNFGHTPYQVNEQRVMVLSAATETSKPIIEWRDNQGHKVAWIVAHYKLDANTVHQHISIETCKADMNTVITRFQVTYGQDIVAVKVTNADFEVDGQLLARRAISLATAVISQSQHLAGQNDCILLADSTAGKITINLDTTAGNPGRYYMIKKIDGSNNKVIIDAYGTQQIDGASTYELSERYKYVQLVSDGANWFIVGGN